MVLCKVKFLEQTVQLPLALPLGAAWLPCCNSQPMLLPTTVQFRPAIGLSEKIKLSAHSFPQEIHPCSPHVGNRAQPDAEDLSFHPPLQAVFSTVPVKRLEDPADEAQWPEREARGGVCAKDTCILDSLVATLQTTVLCCPWGNDSRHRHRTLREPNTHRARICI